MSSLQVSRLLVPHAIWSSSSSDRRIVYVTVRRRRRVAVWGGAVAASLVVAAILTAWLVPLLLAASAVLVGSAEIALSGAAGFYAVGGDGTLREFLGRRRPPDLSGLRRQRVRGRLAPSWENEKD